MASLHGSAPNSPIRRDDCFRSTPIFCGNLSDIERIRRRRAQHTGFEISEQGHLTFGSAARHRHDRAPEPFCPVVCAEASREQTVPVGVVDDIARHGPGTRETASH